MYINNRNVFTFILSFLTIEVLPLPFSHLWCFFLAGLGKREEVIERMDGWMGVVVGVTSGTDSLKLGTTIKKKKKKKE